MFRSSFSEGTLLEINPAALKMFGYESAEGIQAIDLYMDPSDRARLKSALAQEGFLESFEARLQRKDGSTFWGALSIRFRREDGTIEGVVLDISERQRAEAERQVIFEIIEGVNRTLDLKHLLELIHVSLSRVINVENFFVALYNPAEDSFDFPFFVDRFDHPPTSIKAGRTCSAYVFRAGRPLLLHPEEFHQLQAAGEVDLVGTLGALWVGIPLKTPAGPIGVMVVQHYDDPRAFTERDVEFLMSVGNQVALAIDRKRTEEALRASEERYRSFVRQSTEGIWRFEIDQPLSIHLPEDEQIRLIFDRATLAECNDAMAQMYGYVSAEDILGMRLSRFLMPGDPRNIEFMRCFIRTGYRLTNAETVERTRSGEMRHFLNNLVGTVENGQLLRGWGMQQDITERVRTDEALRKSDERFHFVTRATNDVVADWNLQTNELWWNEGVQTQFGYRREDLEPGIESWQNRLHPDDRERVLAGIERFIHSSGKIWTDEYRFRRADGSFAHVVDRAYLIRDERGRPGRLIGAMKDVTEPKRAEEAQARLTAILEATPDLVGIADAQGQTLYMNRAGRRMLGFGDEEDLSSLAISSIYPDRARDTLRHEATPQLIREGVWTGELALLAREGAEIPVSQVSLAHQDGGGKIQFFSIIARDITEQRKAEEALWLSEAQLRQAQKMEAVGRLAGGVAHDFNNLLTAITGYAELMLERLDAGNSMRRHVEEIQKAADRAATLTQQLLAFSRKQMLQPKIVDLNDIVADMDQMLRRLIGEHMQLITRRHTTLGKTKADPGQMGQVLLNLVVNARDAMPQGGTILVETADAEVDAAQANQHPGLRPGPYVLLKVTDTGHGMEDEVKSHLFEPFFTTKEKGKGTGLGLSTVYGIVKQSGGYVYVDSEVGKGTSFQVYLPRLEESAETKTIGEAKPLPRTGTETILLVEDEDSVRNLVRDILQMNGYTVFDARDGREALDLCGQHPEHIHLLLTDVIMPQMSGRELAEKMTSLKPQTKILFMSGYTDDALLHQNARVPAVSYLQKPFTPETLTRKVREVLDVARGS